MGTRSAKYNDEFKKSLVSYVRKRQIAVLTSPRIWGFFKCFIKMD